MHQAGYCIDSDVRFHSKIPLVALLCLVHLGIALFPDVLGGDGRGDDRGIHDSTFPHEQLTLSQVHADLIENPLAQVVALQQMSELKERRGVGHGFMAQVNPRESAHRLTIVKGILERFVRQGIPLLKKVDA